MLVLLSSFLIYSLYRPGFLVPRNQTNSQRLEIKGGLLEGKRKLTESPRNSRIGKRSGNMGHWELRFRNVVASRDCHQPQKTTLLTAPAAVPPEGSRTLLLCILARGCKSLEENRMSRASPRDVSQQPGHMATRCVTQALVPEGSPADSSQMRNHPPRGEAASPKGTTSAGGSLPSMPG